MSEEDWATFIVFGIGAVIGVVGMSFEAADSLYEKWWTDSEVWIGPAPFVAYLSVAMMTVIGVFS